MMRNVAQAAGVARLHPHLLRHTAATQYMVNGGDAISLQHRLGHSGLEMSNRYVHFASAELAAIQERVVPMGNFEIKPMRVPRKKWGEAGSALCPRVSRDSTKRHSSCPSWRSTEQTWARPRKHRLRVASKYWHIRHLRPALRRERFRFAVGHFLRTPLLTCWHFVVCFGRSWSSTI
jgi:hypothetical protein